MDAVRFEFSTERMQAGGSFWQVEAEQADTVAFEHGCFCRISQAAHGIFGIVTAHTVYQQINGILGIVGVFFNTDYFSIHLQPIKPLFHVHFYLFGGCTSFTG